MKIIADLISRTLKSVGSKGELSKIEKQVKDLCGKFPLYKD